MKRLAPLAVFCLSLGLLSTACSPRPTVSDAEPEASDSPAEVAVEPVSAEEAAAIEALRALARTEADRERVVALDRAGHAVEINLSGTGAKDEDLAPIADCPRVTAISMSLPEMTNEGLRALVDLPNLERLDLEGCAFVTDDGIRLLEQVQSLRDLSVKRSGVKDGALECMANMPNLTRIRAAQTDVSSDGLAFLAGKTNLELLDFRDCNKLSDAGLAHLSGLTSLKDLKLWGPQITDAGMTHLKGLTNLRVLSLPDTNVSNDGMKPLAELTNLQDLSLMRSPVFDEGLEFVGRLTKLRRLDLRGAPVTSVGVAHLGGLRELERLDLSETAVDDQALEILKRLPKLRELELWATRITNEGARHLAEMKQLERLNLDSIDSPSDDQYLTDEGLGHLAALENLQWLNLSNAKKITDAGLDHLAGLKQLSTLKLSFCDSVTDAGVERLRSAIPNLKIER